MPRSRRRPPVRFEEDRREDDRRMWELDICNEVPEFQRTLQPEEFINLLGTTEEVMEFKEVLEKIKVPLVATRLWGRATTWCQQFKLTRNGLGK